MAGIEGTVFTFGDGGMQSAPLALGAGGFGSNGGACNRQRRSRGAEPCC